MKNFNTQALERNSPEPLLRRSEVAQIFGVQPPAIARWESEGKIKAVRIGRTVRYTRSEVEKLKQQATPAASVTGASVSPENKPSQGLIEIETQSQ